MLTLAKNIWKKNRKTLLSFSIILLLSSMLFNSALMIQKNFRKEYEKKFEQLNTANVFFTIPKTEYNNDILSDIQKINNITDTETRKGILLTIPVQIGNTLQDQETIFYDINDNRKISQYNIVEQIKAKNNYYIYLSNYTYKNAKIAWNDNFTFSVNEKNYSFPVLGIVEEMQYGNYSSEVIGQFLSSGAYFKLLEENETKEVMTLLIKSTNSYESYQKISKLLMEKQITILNRNYDEQSKNSRLAIPNILVILLVVFSFVILIISLLVSKFKIENAIEEEMSNLGVLKALGYTSKEIMFANMFPYLLSGLISSVLGATLSYTITPILAHIIELQTGFIWNVSLDILLNSFITIFNLILVTIFTILAIRKIKKLDPINAIRGINPNKISKNFFEIEKTNASIGWNLALKNYANSKNQNRLLGIVLFFITLITSFVGILFYNVNLYPKNFVDTLVEEYPNVAVFTDIDIKDELISMNEVKNVIYYDENGSITLKDNVVKTFIADDFQNVQNDICYEGTNPKNKNEIAIGSKIKEQYNLKLNDDLELEKNGRKKKYRIVGFIQSVNNSGEVIELTLDGYQNLENDYIPKTMYIYLKNQTDTEEFMKKIEQKYNEKNITIINYDKSMSAAMKLYISLVSLISIAVFIITILMIYLVLYMLMSSMISKRKQELGILKALGYRNRQLILQMIGGFLPSIIGVLFGLIVSKLSMNYIYKTLFKAIGVHKIQFQYPLTLFIIVTIFIIISTFIIASIIANRIKKISVYSLMKD